jgi:hypothetical protein
MYTILYYLRVSSIGCAARFVLPWLDAEADKSQIINWLIPRHRRNCFNAKNGLHLAPKSVIITL